MAAEYQIEETVVNKAKRAGWETRKVQWVGRRGAMDRVFFGHGRCVWIEFKDPDNDLAGQQKREFDRLKALYPEVHCCCKVGEALAILGIE